MVVFPLSLLFLGCNSLFMILMMRISPLINSHLEVSLLNISDADSITRTQKQQKHTHTQEIFKIDQIISPSNKNKWHFWELFEIVASPPSDGLVLPRCNWPANRQTDGS